MQILSPLDAGSREELMEKSTLAFWSIGLLVYWSLQVKNNCVIDRAIKFDSSIK
jgi:hypothetical protein